VLVVEGLDEVLGRILFSLASVYHCNRFQYNNKTVSVLVLKLSHIPLDRLSHLPLMANNLH